MKNKKMKKRQFTLIELIIVIVVIGILAAMALPKFLGVQRNAKVAAMETDLDVIEKAVMQYVTATDDGSYPFLDTNGDKIINEEDLYFKTSTEIPKTLSDSLLKASGDDGSKIYKLDMDKLKPYISKIKYPDTEYLYSEKSDTAIDPIGKADGDNFIHHIIGSGNVDGSSNGSNKEEVVTIEKNKNFSIGYYANMYIGKDKEVYAAGDLSDGSLATTKYTKMTTNANAKKVVSSYNNWAYINENGEVYTLGSNADGQLGRPYTDGNYDFSNTFGLAKLPDGIKAVDIELTQYTTVVLGNDGNLYVCGYNIYFKDLYDKSVYEIEELTKLPLPNGKKVIDFDGSDMFLSAIDEDGVVYINGNSGLVSAIPSNYRSWTALELENPAIKVTTSERSLIVVDNKGDLYGIGKNEQGELGFGDKVLKDKFAKIPLKEGIKVKSIEGLMNTFVFLTKDNDLYGMGYNTYGLFGVDYSVQYNFTTPTQIKYDGVEKIKTLYDVNGSNTQSLAFEGVDGVIYGIGYNGLGQFGLGNTNSIMNKPININLADKIKK